MNTTESDIKVFWGEISPCEHIVQIYEEDAAFLDALQGFVGGGILAGNAVVVVATSPHLEALDARLSGQGLNVSAARLRKQYLTFNAEQALSEFMVNGWPDDVRFQQFVTRVLHQARKGGHPVRVFGEMVAVLWAQGHNGATVRLEHLWSELCRTESFSLFCAYPKSGFTRNADASIREICATHSRVIAPGVN